MTRDKLLAVRGLLTAAAWDDAGNATRVAVLTRDEDQYLISDDQAGRELLGYLKEEVVVWGTLQTGYRGEKVLRVTGFDVHVWSEDTEAGWRNRPGEAGP